MDDKLIKRINELTAISREFYGKGYSSVKDEDGNDVKPEHYVTYLITAYPDYADGGEYVTRRV